MTFCIFENILFVIEYEGVVFMLKCDLNELDKVSDDMFDGVTSEESRLDDDEDEPTDYLSELDKTETEQVSRELDWGAPVGKEFW